MNPIIDLNFWLYLGSLISTTAIALFAIKSGYFDNKINNVSDVNAKLIEFSGNIEEKYKELYAEDIRKICHECEYNNGNSLFGIDLLNISKFDINTLNNSLKLIDREYRSLMESVLKEYVEKNIIQPMYKDFSIDIPLNVFREFFIREYSVKDVLNVDKTIKKTLTLLYTKTIDAIQSNNIEYRLIDSKKKKFDEIFSDERILYFFGTGISIQFLSLFAPPIIITKVAAISLAILAMVITIKCMDQFDEIHPFYEMVVTGEDEYNKETHKASK